MTPPAAGAEQASELCCGRRKPQRVQSPFKPRVASEGATRRNAVVLSRPTGQAAADTPVSHVCVLSTVISLRLVLRELEGKTVEEQKKAWRNGGREAKVILVASIHATAMTQ